MIIATPQNTYNQTEKEKHEGMRQLLYHLVSTFQSRAKDLTVPHLTSLPFRFGLFEIRGGKCISLHNNCIMLQKIPDEPHSIRAVHNPFSFMMVVEGEREFMDDYIHARSCGAWDGGGLDDATDSPWRRSSFLQTLFNPVRELWIETCNKTLSLIRHHARSGI